MKKMGFFNMNIRGRSTFIFICISLMICFFWNMYLYSEFLWCSENGTPSNKYLLDLLKRRSKLQEENMSCERALNFDQWKAFLKNYKPITAWLSLAYKFTENICRSRLFFEFIHTQKRYPTSLDKISILTWKLFVIPSQNFSCELNSQRIHSL